MSESPNKKHKKHKKHKHKRKHGDQVEADMEADHGLGDQIDEDVDVISTGQPQVTQPSIKLKIKLGGQPVTEGQPVAGGQPVAEGQPVTGATNSTKKKKKVHGSSTPPKQPDLPPPIEGPSTPSKEGEIVWEEGKVKGEDVFLTKKKGDDTSDEEQEWLDALEAGTLDDSGAVKKNPDESLMTSRQRALIHGKPEEVLQQLPSGYKVPEFTEEQLQRRMQRAKKRRDLAFEKQEKEKKQTLDRLLKKQESKMKRGKMKSKRNQAPGYRYNSNVTGHYVCVPQGFNFPFSQQQAKLPPAQISCGVEGCNNQKKYSCSKTGIPLCSLECYKRNLSIPHSSGAAVVM